MAEAADPAGLCSLAQAFRSVMRMIATVPMWPMARQNDPSERAEIVRFAEMWMSLAEPIDEARGAYEFPR
jgi:hypothetical protein